ncbi:MAG: ABC transporter ATP-binding protein [Peptostreptococcaceae bacterium]
MENAIEIKNLCKLYDGFKIDKLNLVIPSGCIMGIIGENGAGKSTTIKLMLDIIKKDSGTIKILGKDSTTIDKDFKEQIGVVFDDSCFPEELNITHIEKILKNVYKTWDSKTFNKYISRFALPKKKIIKEFSKGMKMKLSIAVALSHNPKVLILDEATSGLDPVAREEILDVFWDFVQDESHTVLISSHILSDLEKICDYIAFIHRGKLVFNEAKDELSEKYGILKCSNEDLDLIDRDSIISYRKSSFSAEALVLKEEMPRNYIVDNASIEDIMLYYVKEDVGC